MANIDPKLVVHSDPEILGKTLFDYFEAGDILEIFLDEFPR
jgi:hypothetical protein